MGLIEALDVLLIACVAQIIGLGLYVLFIDETLPLSARLRISNLDDLYSHLPSSVIAVLKLCLDVTGKHLSRRYTKRRVAQPFARL